MSKTIKKKSKGSYTTPRVTTRHNTYTPENLAKSKGEKRSKCLCHTRSGKQCSRNAKKGESYCYQHLDCNHKTKKVAKSSHPSYAIMVGRAIKAEQNTKGSTRYFIKKYLQVNYKIDPKSQILKNAFSKLINAEEGPRLIPNARSKGHYRLSKELKSLVKDD